MEELNRSQFLVESRKRGGSSSRPFREKHRSTSVRAASRGNRENRPSTASRQVRSKAAGCRYFGSSVGAAAAGAAASARAGSAAGAGLGVRLGAGAPQLRLPSSPEEAVRQSPPCWTSERFPALQRSSRPKDPNSSPSPAGTDGTGGSCSLRVLRLTARLCAGFGLP